MLKSHLGYRSKQALPKWPGHSLTLDYSEVPINTHIVEASRQEIRLGGRVVTLTQEIISSLPEVNSARGPRILSRNIALRKNRVPAHFVPKSLGRSPPIRGHVCRWAKHAIRDSSYFLNLNRRDPIATLLHGRRRSHGYYEEAENVDGITITYIRSLKGEQWDSMVSRTAGGEKLPIQYSQCMSKKKNEAQILVLWYITRRDILGPQDKRSLTGSWYMSLGLEYKVMALGLGYKSDPFSPNLNPNSTLFLSLELSQAAIELKSSLP
ncbi:hypothetical protein VNO77_08573 [Canavalia gladiata]|uniref:Uncharacterized protein n=1 Tax=Canavalia gladiata TaxID=3824 RepID=A0AAN9M9A1_CANGL